MAGGREHLIVIPHRHGKHGRTGTFPDGPQTLQAVLIGILRRRQNYLVMGKEIGPGRTNTALLGTGDGMARYHPGWQFSEYRLHIGNKTGLGTAHIRKNGALFDDGPNLFQHRTGGPHRNGQHHQITALYGLLDGIRSLVYYTQFNAESQFILTGIKTGHHSRKLLRAYGAGQRTANQPQADNRNPTKRRTRNCHFMPPALLTPMPQPAHQENVHFLAEGRPIHAGAGACHNQRRAEQSRHGPTRPDRYRRRALPPRRL